MGFVGILRNNEMKKPSVVQQWYCWCKLVRRLQAQLCSDDSIQILWKLAWIVARIANVTIQSNFTRICMQSSEHNGANISPPICTNTLNSSKCIFSILFYLHWKLKRSVSVPTCQFSSAGQSLIQPFLKPFEHNLGQKSSYQKAIPAHGRAHFSPRTKSALANWTVLALI